MKKLANTQKPAFYVVIPARYASTRLPGKPLVDIAGKPMVVWVAERAHMSGAHQVVIATDDQRILDAAQHHGFAAVMTRIDHVSGTDRIAEVAAHQGWADDAIVVNVQGDEPLIEAALIIEVATALANSKDAVMATACHVHECPSFVSQRSFRLIFKLRLQSFITVAADQALRRWRPMCQPDVCAACQDLVADRAAAVPHHHHIAESRG